MFDQSYQLHKRHKATHKRDKKKGAHATRLMIVIYSHSSYRPRPLILIGTLKMEERTKAILLKIKVCQSYQPE